MPNCAAISRDLKHKKMLSMQNLEESIPNRYYCIFNLTLIVVDWENPVRRVAVEQDEVG